MANSQPVHGVIEELGASRVRVYEHTITKVNMGLLNDVTKRGPY
jgi:hypothetical protein